MRRTRERHSEMPLYEYSCRACQERFEVLQRMGAGAESIRCPACGAAEVERRFSTFAATVARSGRSSDGDFSGCGRPQCGSGFT